MKDKVLIVGLGGMGINYFKAFNKFYDVYGIDKKKRIKEIFSKKILLNNYSHTFKKFPKKFDLVIVSTTSDVRFKVFKILLKNIKFNHIIFEKILFNDLRHYSKALKLIKKNKINSFVNCTNRMYNYVNFIKKYLKSNILNRIEMTGSNWGLCCNYIHYIDLFLFILNRKKFDSYNPNFSNKLAKSRIINYFELFGNLKFKINNTKVLIKCNKTKSSKISYKLNFYFQNNKRIIIDEINNKLLLRNKKHLKDYKIKIPYTSDVLLKFYKDIKHKKSKKDFKKLISFEDSIDLHLPVLNSFSTKFKELKIIKNKNICPIT